MYKVFIDIIKYMCIMPAQKRKYKRRKKYKRYKKESYKKFMPSLEKCPFIIGSNNYHHWKAQRYPQGVGRPKT
jgi:hypothetical protein